MADVFVLVFDRRPLEVDLALQRLDLSEQLVPLFLLHHFVVFQLFVDFLAIFLPFLYGTPFFVQLLLELFVVCLLLLLQLGHFGLEARELELEFIKVVLAGLVFGELVLCLRVQFHLHLLVHLPQIIDSCIGFLAHCHCLLSLVLAFLQFSPHLLHKIRVRLPLVFQDHHFLGQDMHFMPESVLPRLTFVQLCRLLERLLNRNV